MARDSRSKHGSLTPPLGWMALKAAAQSNTVTSTVTAVPDSGIGCLASAALGRPLRMSACMLDLVILACWKAQPPLQQKCSCCVSSCCDSSDSFVRIQRAGATAVSWLQLIKRLVASSAALQHRSELNCRFFCKRPSTGR